MKKRDILIGAIEQEQQRINDEFEESKLHLKMAETNADMIMLFLHTMRKSSHNTIIEFLSEVFKHPFFKTAKVVLRSDCISYNSEDYEVCFPTTRISAITIVRKKRSYGYISPSDNRKALESLKNLEILLSTYISSNRLSDYLKLVSLDIKKSSYIWFMKIYKYLTKKKQYTPQLLEMLREKIATKEKNIQSFEEFKMNDEIGMVKAIKFVLSLDDLVQFSKSGWRIELIGIDYTDDICKKFNIKKP